MKLTFVTRQKMLIENPRLNVMRTRKGKIQGKSEKGKMCFKQRERVEEK
jgi:hypothetical protein